MNETLRPFQWLDTWPCLAADFPGIVSPIFSPFSIYFTCTERW